MSGHTFPSCRLRDVAEIRVSNVDKKTYSAETAVRLCNYLDVYTNDYITADMEFMIASASKAEIERFGLLHGDVIITKDSETPDDIGIPSVIVDAIEHLVCGYHLAMIRPRNGKIDPVYLAKQLSSSSCRKYFAVHASGSTRFGLSIGAIENLAIPLAPREEQTKIAEILSTVDRAIDQTEVLIAKQQRIKTGLMQDLLRYGIDEHGNLRSETSHEFKDSPLGYIPVEWSIEPVASVALKVTDGDHHTPKRAVEGYYLLSARNVLNGTVDLTDVDYVPEVEYLRMLRRCNPEPGDILVSCSGTIGRVCAVPEWLRCVLVRSAALIKFRRSQVDTRYAEWVMRSEAVQRQIVAAQRQAAQPNLFQGEIARLLLLIPPVSEQIAIAARLDASDATIRSELRHLEKLKSLKTGLMQDLLTGRRRVTALLPECSEATA